MSLRGELLYVTNPARVHIKWIIFWAVFIIGSIVGMYQVAAHVRTHSLPTGQMELTVPYTKYLVGEDITFTLKNGFNATIFVTNECPSEPLMVYRQEAGKWVRIHDNTSATDCPNESRQVRVKPNGVVSGSFANWKNLFATPGKYRIVAFVEYYNALPYADFEVINKPVAAQAAPQQVANAGSSSVVLNAKTQAAQQQSSSTTSTTTTPSTPSSGGGTSQTPAHTPVRYDVTVKYNYSYIPASLNLIAGDYIVFTYQNPAGSEGPQIITSFSPNSIQSFTMEHDYGPVTRTFSSKGTWTFYNSHGGTGTITVK